MWEDGEEKWTCERKRRKSVLEEEKMERWTGMDENEYEKCFGDVWERARKRELCGREERGGEEREKLCQERSTIVLG